MGSGSWGCLLESDEPHTVLPHVGLSLVGCWEHWELHCTALHCTALQQRALLTLHCSVQNRQLSDDPPPGWTSSTAPNMEKGWGRCGAQHPSGPQQHPAAALARCHQHLVTRCPAVKNELSFNR